jgi:hypothetical protein
MAPYPHSLYVPRKISISLILLLAMLSLIACGSGDGNGPTPATTERETTIGPAGGIVRSNDEKAEINIPAGALSEDTHITVIIASVSIAGSIGNIYSIGPDGTMFNQPATISISYDESLLSDHSESDLRLATITNNQWVVLNNSTVDIVNNIINGTTQHLSFFSIITLTDVAEDNPQPGDSDRDTDGTPDRQDPQPDNPESPHPTDRPGCEQNKLGCSDKDGDGVPDYQDPQPDNPESPHPTDRPGCEQNKLGCSDKDGDGVPDYQDPPPDNPEPLDIVLPTPDPDPCDIFDVPCESAFIDPVIVFTTGGIEGLSTEVWDANGIMFSLSWVRGENLVDLIITLPGQEPLRYLQLDSGLPSFAIANLVGAAIALLNGSPNIAAPSMFLRDAARIAAPRNTAGCDGPWGIFRPRVDNSNRGRCCDTHDVCIHENCQGPHNSGDVLECAKKGNDFLVCEQSCEESSLADDCFAFCIDRFPPCSDECLECHREVIECFESPDDPGPSQCTVFEDCEKPQQCIIGEIIITDPCTCVENGVEPVNPCTDPNREGSNWGDPHLVTFDRLAYDFQAVGEFILVMSLNDSFEVQTRSKSWRGSRLVSVNTAVAMNVEGDRVAFYTGRDPFIYINGVGTTLSVGLITLPNGGQLTFSGNVYTVTWPDNSQVQVTNQGSYLNLKVLVSDGRRGQLVGLLGNLDGDMNNDLITRDGVTLSTRPSFNELYKQYGESWRISQEESLFDYFDAGENTGTHTDRTFPSGFATTAMLPADVRQQAEQVCRNAGVIDPVLLEACILDVGITNDLSFAEFPANVTPPEESIELQDISPILLDEDFEDGVLDGRITIETRSVPLVPDASGGAGIKSIPHLGSAKAFGFGRSSCPASCFSSYTSTLKVTLDEPTFVAAISFRYMELFHNWGSNGTIFIDGVSLTGGRDFEGIPSNSGQADTTFTEGVFPVNRVVTVIELRVVDITNLSEIYIDDLQIFTADVAQQP